MNKPVSYTSKDGNLLREMRKMLPVTTLRRKDLPNFATLVDRYRYDPVKLHQSYLNSVTVDDGSGRDYQHNLEINSAEDPNHPNYYGTDRVGYSQVNLTSFDVFDTKQGYLKSTWQWYVRGNATPEEKRAMYRKLVRNSADLHATQTELSFQVDTDLLDPYCKEVLSMFRGPVTRVRWAVAQPGFHMTPHIDYDPRFAVRYHLPVVTNPDAFLCVNRKGTIERRHLPVDGKVTFLNAGYTHWVENLGKEPRIHLVVTVMNQVDLPHNA